MSGDEMKKVQSGEPLVIPANTYNRFIGAAQAVEGGQLSIVAPKQRSAPELSPGVVSSYNYTDATVPYFAVVELWWSHAGHAPLIIKPVQEPDSLFGIALEPIAPTAYGRVAIAGGPWWLRCGDWATSDIWIGPVDDSWNAAQYPDDAEYGCWWTLNEDWPLDDDSNKVKVVFREAWRYQNVTGYNAAQQQYLKNNYGALRWVNVE